MRVGGLLQGRLLKAFLGGRHSELVGKVLERLHNTNERIANRASVDLVGEMLIRIDLHWAHCQRLVVERRTTAR